MITFYQFLENTDQPKIQIKLGNLSQSSTSPSKKFIEDIINETNAKPNQFDPNSFFFIDNDNTLVIFNIATGFLAPNSVSIGELRTEPQKTGAGSRFMQKLCDKADSSNITLELSAVPLKVKNKIPKTKLKQFYKKFKFKPATGIDEMVRTPQN